MYQDVQLQTIIKLNDVSNVNVLLLYIYTSTSNYLRRKIKIDDIICAPKFNHIDEFDDNDKDDSSDDYMTSTVAAIAYFPR